MLVLAVDYFTDYPTDKIGKSFRAAKGYSQYGYCNQYNDDHSSRNMRASLIRGNLVIVTVNIDIDDNTGLVRFLHGIHLLVIIGPQN